MSLEGWRPVERVRFTDADIVAALRTTPEHERRGNLWTFFDALPAPERDRLRGEADAQPPTDA